MQPVRLSKLAAEVGCEWEGEEDPLITGAAGIEAAAPGDITFVADKRHRQHLADTRAAAVILEPGTECRIPVLRADTPYAVFTRVLARFASPRERSFPPGIHPTAVVDPTAEVGEGVSLGPYCVVGAGAKIGSGSALGAHVVVGPDVIMGEGCLIYPQVTLREGCMVGRGVILHSGAVIGSDGFGYLPEPNGLRKIPQIGIVVLEDDVEIGANSCVDRATTGRTVVGAGTKIDNQVQVAHNVTIGKNCAISAQTGISGSCRIGEQVTCGGKVGVGDHISIGDGAKLAGGAGIINDVPAGSTMFWYPAFELKQAFRMLAMIKRIPELLDRLRRLESQQRDRAEQGEDPKC